MTRSVNLKRYPEADYTPNDMGVPDTLYGKVGQKVGEWELMSQEEKENEIIKMDEIKLDLL